MGAVEVEGLGEDFRGSSNLHRVFPFTSVPGSNVPIQSFIEGNEALAERLLEIVDFGPSERETHLLLKVEGGISNEFLLLRLQFRATLHDF